jgi:hypothetical protein
MPLLAISNANTSRGWPHTSSLDRLARHKVAGDHQLLIKKWLVRLRSLHLQRGDHVQPSPHPTVLEIKGRK